MRDRARRDHNCTQFNVQTVAYKQCDRKLCTDDDGTTTKAEAAAQALAITI